jgi:hypothetical protein
VKQKPPPLLPGSEPTIAFERSPPPVSKPKIDSLLPPGAEEAVVPAEMSRAAVETPPNLTLPSQGLSAFGDIKMVPEIAGGTTQEKSLQRAERRFWKNAILFGVSIVVLLMLFYWMAQ